MEDIIEFLGYITGEILIFLLTFGKLKPNLNYDAMGAHHELRIQKSVWVGYIFWGAVFLLTAWLIAMK